MKIGIVGLRGYPFPDAYGKIVAQVGPRLRARGHEVTVFVRHKWARVKREERDGMEIVSLPHVPTKSFDTLTYGVSSCIASLFRGFDVLHFHGTALAPFSLLPRLFGQKTVVHVHALDWQRDKFGWLGRRVLKGFERLAVQFPDETAVISKTLKSQIDGAHGGSCFHIPQGVVVPPPRTIRPVHEFGLEGKPYALYVGRLVPEKACDVLIRAFQASGVSGKLVLAGEGSYSSSYVEKLHRLAGPEVIFTGSLGESGLATLYSGASAYVQPSKVEGLSMALLEAMSYGVATVVSDIPANLEAVGKAALVFPEGDESSLAQKLKNLFYDQETRDDIGARCRAHVASTFGWDSVVDATEFLYLRATGGNRASAPLEESSGSEPDPGPAPAGASGSGSGRLVGPHPHRASGVLLRSSSHRRRPKVSHVEAEDDGAQRGEEVRVGPTPEPGTDGTLRSNSLGSSGHPDRAHPAQDEHR